MNCSHYQLCGRLTNIAKVKTKLGFKCQVVFPDIKFVRQFLFDHIEWSAIEFEVFWTWTKRLGNINSDENAVKANA